MTIDIVYVSQIISSFILIISGLKVLLEKIAFLLEKSNYKIRVENMELKRIPFSQLAERFCPGKLMSEKKLYPLTKCFPMF